MYSAQWETNEISLMFHDSYTFVSMKRPNWDLSQKLWCSSPRLFFYHWKTKANLAIFFQFSIINGEMLFRLCGRSDRLGKSAISRDIIGGYLWNLCILFRCSWALIFDGMNGQLFLLVPVIVLWKLQNIKRPRGQKNKSFCVNGLNAIYWVWNGQK